VPHHQSHSRAHRVGIPLFGPTAGDIALEHVATRAYATGLVQSEYAVRSG
jgi:hypothetical protein